MEREISMLQERINQASQSSNETNNRYHISKELLKAQQN